MFNIFFVLMKITYICFETGREFIFFDCRMNESMNEWMCFICQMQNAVY